jgi:hypothetical protein
MVKRDPVQYYDSPLALIWMAMGVIFLPTLIIGMLFLLAT